MRGRIVRGILVFALAACTIGLLACSQQGSTTSDQGPDYIDDRAMSILARGFEKRSDYIKANDTTSNNGLKAAIQVEIDNDAELKAAQFEDSKMQELVLEYLNSLDDQIAVLDNYRIGTTDYYTAWEKAYNNRSKIIKELVDDYGLTVGDQYKDSFDELIANGTNVTNKEASDQAINEMLNAASWEKEDLGYGNYKYTAVIENTTEFDLKNVSIVLNLFDADDIKTETYANAQTWRKGEKVKFEAWGNGVDAARIEAIIQYYSIGS